MPDGSCCGDLSESLTHSKSLDMLARVVARFQGQPAGKEEESDTTDVNEPLLAPKSAEQRPPPSHSGLSLDVQKKCEFKASLVMRRAVRTLTTRRIRPLPRGQLLKCVKERSLHLVKDVEVNDGQDASRKDCFVMGIPHHHGSQLLAAVMARWPSFSRFGSSQLPWNHIVRARQSGWNLKRRILSHRLWHLFILVGRDRSKRNGSIYQDRNPRRVGPH